MTSEEFRNWLEDTLKEKEHRGVLDSYIKQQEANISRDVYDIRKYMNEMNVSMSNMNLRIDDSNSLILAVFAIFIAIGTLGPAGYFGYQIYIKKKIQQVQQF